MTLEDRFEQHPWRTGIGLGAKITGLVVVLIVVFTILGFALSWFQTGVAIVSPANVKEQYRFGYEYDRAMVASAENVCVGERRHLEPSALAAYEQTYNNTKAKYDARMANVFQAKKVKPGDLPLVAPTLSEREKSVCP